MPVPRITIQGRVNTTQVQKTTVLKGGHPQVSSKTVRGRVNATYLQKIEVLENRLCQTPRNTIYGRVNATRFLECNDLNYSAQVEGSTPIRFSQKFFPLQFLAFDYQVQILSFGFRLLTFDSDFQSLILKFRFSVFSF